MSAILLNNYYFVVCFLSYCTFHVIDLTQKVKRHSTIKAIIKNCVFHIYEKVVNLILKIIRFNLKIHYVILIRPKINELSVNQVTHKSPGSLLNAMRFFTYNTKNNNNKGKVLCTQIDYRERFSSVEESPFRRKT